MDGWMVSAYDAMIFLEIFGTVREVSDNMSHDLCILKGDAVDFLFFLPQNTAKSQAATSHSHSLTAQGYDRVCEQSA